jgi:hypothetical protein
MANVKAARSDGFLQFVFGLLVNERMEFTLRDVVEERAHLAFLASNLKFDAAIRQVADPSSYIEALGDVAQRPAKPDALHMSLVENLERNHSRWLFRSCWLLEGRHRATHRESGIGSSFHL